MNREIKFRAWNWENMIYANWISKWNFLIIDWWWRSIQNTKFWMKDPIIFISHKEWNLMQYTWLKDKNWKEIYEGDILQDKDDRFYREDNYDIVSIPDFHVWSDQEHMETYEIIWNIYENPELLK